MLKNLRGQPTSHDIAEMVGVSQPTVSKALRGCRTINEDTRRRVMEAAKALNYTVNRNAARLRSKRTNTIALVVICRPEDARSDINPFYLSLLGCVATAASDAGYDLLVSFQDETQDFYGQYEDGKQADGLLVIGSAENKRGWDYFGKLHEQGKAVICWGAPGDDLLCVTGDNRHGGAMATQHMIDHGRTAIAFVGPTDSSQRQFGDRHAGYMEAMRAAGLGPLPAQYVAAVTREEQGYLTTAAMLDSGLAFDGIFAACDLIGIGALRCLNDRGVKVPADVSLVGFDGIKATKHCTPAMTTIEQDFRKAGQLLVQRLLAVIDGESFTDEPVPCRMTVRQSSIPPIPRQ
ncbi:substrate-binding domain-containing protein [Sphingomonas lacunae]|uniref:substrate-binding domain-containing protein n=1 Tax=Sphingomonas lacunae TaxID=2698828 RepID=UPI001FE82827|nr:substrate-binding domain-containing protein [Sphingomonas lacunae]